MNIVIRTWARRIACSSFALVALFALTVYWCYRTEAGGTRRLTDGELNMRMLVIPALGAVMVFTITTLFASGTAKAAPSLQTAPSPLQTPFKAQVVGLQWLNPLQRRDYPTEWQLLWTMGISGPNKDDDMVKSDPSEFSKLQSISSIAYGGKGTESFSNYHLSYVEDLTNRFRDIYFMDSKYFYNAHSLKDKTTWRELAGIHVEYALPEDRLDPLGKH